MNVVFGVAGSPLAKESDSKAKRLADSFFNLATCSFGVRNAGCCTSRFERKIYSQLFLQLLTYRGKCLRITFI